MKDRTSRAILAVLLLASFAARAWRLDQPIVENYVGRQIPTAMVARNLERGSGFLHPQLDTGPFPNLFLVEPPIYQATVVFSSKLFGFNLSESGRLVSSAATLLAAWGLFGLVRRREGNAAAILSVGVFSLAPIVFRFGRAFQPDMLMLGLQLASLRIWNEKKSPGRLRIAFAWALSATSLAVKITSAYVLIPLFFMVPIKTRFSRILILVSALIPALLWYAYAASLVHASAGSRASSDNLAIWLASISESWNLRSAEFFIRYLLFRSFTPIGFFLACLGYLFMRRSIDRIWWIWGGSALAGLVISGGKAHHEYYWLTIAPLMAFGAGKGLAELWVRGFRGRVMSVAAGSSLAIASIASALPTFRTPAEWSGLEIARSEIRRLVPKNAMIVAPEALLFECARRGARLEFSASACRRGAGEWGETLENPSALSLVDFYRTQGIDYVADVGPAPVGSVRRELRDALRRRDRSRVLVDRADVFLAVLPRLRGSSLVKGH